MADRAADENGAVRWIDAYYIDVLERPAMFAASPAVLEGVVWVLEGLRHDILTGAGRGSTSPYQTYLAQHGFHAATFTSYEGDLPAYSSASQDEFGKYASFLRNYLRAHNRPFERPDSEGDRRRPAKDKETGKGQA